MLSIGIILLLVTMLHSFLEIRRAIKRSCLGIFHYIIVWYIFIYGFVPLNLYTNQNCLSLPFRSYWYDLHDNWGWLLFFYVLTYTALYLGYKHSKPTSYCIRLKGSSAKISSQYTIGLLLFCIGTISLLLSIKGYGGISYYVNNVNDIRYGVDENKNYAYAFIKMFSGYIVYAFILLYALTYHIKSTKQKTRLTISLLFCGILLVFYMLLSGGRATMISVFVFLLLLITLQTGKIPSKTIIVFFIPIVFIVFFGKSYISSLLSDNQTLFYDIASSRTSSYWETFMQEFCHQSMAQVTALEDGFGNRFWKDYFIWLFKPMRLWTSDSFYDSISYYTTNQVLGQWRAIIPPGFVGLALYNGGIITLLFQSMLVGIILRKVDSLLHNSNIQSNPLIMCIYLILFDSSWFALQNGDPALIIQASIPFLIFLLYLFLLRKMVIVKTNTHTSN